MLGFFMPFLLCEISDVFPIAKSAKLVMFNALFANSDLIHATLGENV